MPRIRVSVGPSLSALEDISDKVNAGSAHDIVSEAFEGRISIHLKGFTTCGNQPLKDEFFQREDRRGITWSIQVQGLSVALLEQMLFNFFRFQGGFSDLIQLMISCLVTSSANLSNFRGARMQC